MLFKIEDFNGNILLEAEIDYLSVLGTGVVLHVKGAGDKYLTYTSTDHKWYFIAKEK